MPRRAAARCSNHRRRARPRHHHRRGVAAGSPRVGRPRRAGGTAGVDAVADRTPSAEIAAPSRDAAVGTGAAQAGGRASTCSWDFQDGSSFSGNISTTRVGGRTRSSIEQIGTRGGDAVIQQVFGDLRLCMVARGDDRSRRAVRATGSVAPATSSWSRAAATRRSASTRSRGGAAQRVVLAASAAPSGRSTRRRSNGATACSRRSIRRGSSPRCAAKSAACAARSRRSAARRAACAARSRRSW